jgi:hypothetical protein
VSFAAIHLCVSSQRVFIVVIVVISLSTQSGNFWTRPRTFTFHLILHYPCCVVIAISVEGISCAPSPVFVHDLGIYIPKCVCVSS